jgi:ribosomal protein L40E
MGPEARVMQLIKQVQKCQQCGAPVNQDAESCQYCGTEFYSPEKHQAGKKKKALLKDFGWKGILALNIAGIIIIYTLGWFFEDKQYWLDTTATLIWAVPLPLWIVVMTFYWFRPRGTLITGFIIGIVLFAAHFLLILSYENWHVNDDYIGIAAMFAGIALGAWILGRILHHMARIYIVNRR